MCNKARKARDGFIKDATRDEEAAEKARKNTAETLEEEKKKRQEHENEMARLRALLKDLEAKHKALLEKMRAEHKKIMDELERKLREDLERLHKQMGHDGIDMDELMAKAIQALEDEQSPYAPSKIQSMREQLEALLERERALQAELDALRAQQADLQARIADAERRRKEAEDSTPVPDVCEYGDEALADWKANKGDYFLWLEEEAARERETQEVQTDEVLDPTVMISEPEVNVTVTAGRTPPEQSIRVLNTVRRH